MWQQLQPILKSHDILICPTLAVPAVKADHDDADPDFEINGVRLPAYVGWNLHQPLQPAAEPVPGDERADGLLLIRGVPTGMQIVGRPYDDLSVFRAPPPPSRGATRPWQSKRPAI